MNLDDFTSENLAAEEEADRAERERKFRPSWMNQPIEFEGTWVQPARDGIIERDDGKEGFPCWDIPLNDCRFIDVDPKDVGRWRDGDVYIWQVSKPKEGGKLSFSALGMILKAAKVPSLPSLMGSRLHLKETVMKPFLKAENGTRLYTVTKVGNAAPAAPTEPTEAGIEAALGLLSGEGRTEDSLGLAALKTPSINTDGPLVSMIASGKFLPAMIAAGRVTKDGEVYKLVG